MGKQRLDPKGRRWQILGAGGSQRAPPPAPGPVGGCYLDLISLLLLFGFFDQIFKILPFCFTCKRDACFWEMAGTPGPFIIEEFKGAEGLH